MHPCLNFSTINVNSQNIFSIALKGIYKRQTFFNFILEFSNEVRLFHQNAIKGKNYSFVLILQGYYDVLNFGESWIMVKVW